MTDKILGNSIQIERLRGCILRVAPTEARVLILGENGTGKELVAEALHASSRRKDKPFVALNCAAVPESLLESELFGHEKGAFTGASERRAGRFEQADGGTLFLDEIGEMPLAMQSKLLRVLQAGAFERVGGRQTLKVNVRVIAATNKDLRAAVKEKSFREDLYHRIAVIPIQSPPLRERLVDVPILALAFIARSERPNTKLTDAGAEALKRHTWPGNVRELVNVVERMLVIAASDELDEQDVLHALSMDHEYQVAAEPERTSDLDRLTRQVAALVELVGQQREAFAEARRAVESGTPIPWPESHTASVYEALPRARAAFVCGDHVVHNDGKTGALLKEIEGDTLCVALTDCYGLPLFPVVHEVWYTTDIATPNKRQYASRQAMPVFSTSLSALEAS